MRLRKRYGYLAKKDVQKLTCLFCFDGTSLLVTAFTSLPLPIQRHSIKVGSVAGMMARFVPENLIPYGLSCGEYADAVRFGAQYHDIAAYLVYNERHKYPASGERFLREQISERTINPAIRRVILETVQFSGERYDGTGYPEQVAGDKIPLHAGICTVADAFDDIMATRYSFWRNLIIEEARKYVVENSGIIFVPQAVNCFTSANAGITYLYKFWRKNPARQKNLCTSPLEIPGDYEINNLVTQSGKPYIY